MYKAEFGKAAVHEHMGYRTAHRQSDIPDGMPVQLDFSNDYTGLCPGLFP
jgi:hypothetical protein